MPFGIEFVGEYDMHVEQNIMDFCYLKQTAMIHFWIGGQALKTRSGGM
ncbi:MAG TPA: hypothetical protein VFJ05_07325 [Nitrososphaeraceae archaeon]|nr:hypothetical protein [Nitrososphaeraceae archaeon]